MNASISVVVFGSLLVLIGAGEADDKAAPSANLPQTFETADATLAKAGALIIECEVEVPVTVARSIREGDTSRVVTEVLLRKVKRATAHAKGSFRILDVQGKKIGPMGVEDRLKVKREVIVIRDGEIPDVELLKSLDKNAVIVVLAKAKAAAKKQ